MIVFSRHQPGRYVGAHKNIAYLGSIAKVSDLVQSITSCTDTGSQSAYYRHQCAFHQPTTKFVQKSQKS